MALLIRRAEVADLPRLSVLWQELAEMHAQYAREWTLAPDAADLWRAHAAQILEQKDRCLLVADADGLLVGFIVGQVVENPPTFQLRRIGSISDAIVTSGLRHQGVGSLLVTSLLLWFEQQGIAIIHLSVANANPSAQVFWHKMGFRDHMSRMRGVFT